VANIVGACVLILPDVAASQLKNFYLRKSRGRREATRILLPGINPTFI
jgi:hypothetical protein